MGRVRRKKTRFVSSARRKQNSRVRLRVLSDDGLRRDWLIAPASFSCSFPARQTAKRNCKTEGDRSVQP
jgi:hypothetical protein